MAKELLTEEIADIAKLPKLWRKAKRLDFKNPTANKNLMDFFQFYKKGKNHWGCTADWYQHLNRKLSNDVFRNIFLKLKDGNPPSTLAMKNLWAELKPLVSKKVVKDTPTFGKMKLHAYQGGLKYAEEAKEILTKGNKILKKYDLEKLIYGNVFTTNLGKSSVFAHYTVADDSIAITSKGFDRGDAIDSYLHEMGHRFWYKFYNWKWEYERAVTVGSKMITVDYRLKMWKTARYYIAAYLLGDTGRRTRPSASMLGFASYMSRGGNNPYTKWTKPAGEFTDRYNAWAEHLCSKYHSFAKNPLEGFANYIKSQNLDAQFLTGNEEAVKQLYISTAEGDVAAETTKHSEILAPTPYGRTNVQESFAVTFSFYLLDKPLIPELKNAMEKAIKNERP